MMITGKGKIAGQVPTIEHGNGWIIVWIGDVNVKFRSGAGSNELVVQTNQDARVLDVDSYRVGPSRSAAIVPKRAATKTNPARPARASQGSRAKKDNAGYTHYVVTANGQINSGWWYASDAKDVLKEEKENGYPIIGTGARVLARVTLVRMGKDPKVNTNWQFRA